MRNVIAAALDRLPSAISPLNALRRWRIENALPEAQEDLTPEQWNDLYRRYEAAGGTKDRLNALIDARVMD